MIKWSIMAEKAGFQAINCSDHFHPWSERQGQSGFSFSWLGASMQATALPHGVVCSPGQRYHPAIVAQAAATLAEMFPERFWISVGSGEALNERINGEKWPAKDERNARLKESVEIMRKLFNGETVSHRGLITIEEAKLYTRPAKTPLIIGAAVTKQTAEWVGEWADGFITISKPLPELKEMVTAFRKKGGRKPMYLKVQLSYAKTDDDALMGAYDQWRTNIFSGSVLGDLWKVEHFDALGEMVQKNEMKDKLLISSDLNNYKRWIGEYIDLGFEKILLHNVNREQENFIEVFGNQILPAFK